VPVVSCVDNVSSGGYLVVFEARGFLVDKFKLFSLLFHKAFDKIVDPDVGLYVNLGSGLVYRKGWKNLDFVSRWYGSRWLRRLVLDYNHDLSSYRMLPFGSNCVDGFYCRMVFEHLEDEMVRTVMCEVHRCLKVGGTFEIIVPHPDIDVSQYTGDKYDPNVCGHHINTFTPDKMLSMLSSFGFEIEDYDSTYHGNLNAQYFRVRK